MARILVVDDERDIREVVALVLSRVGHEVVCAGDGASALELHTQEVFDLIISDLSMPGLTGIQLARVIRGNEESRVPILLLTASATSDDLAEACAVGVDTQMDKPFRIGDLRDCVAGLLAGVSN